MKDIFEHSPTAKYVAEFVGTFFLVFTVGCHVHSGNIVAALSIGAVLMVMVYALGSVSGAHFNPAVTLAVLISGRDKISPEDACIYMVVQVFGGIVGALTSCSVFGGSIFLPPAIYHVAKVCSVEILYTWALCYVVLNVATTENKVTGNIPNSFFGLAIGFSVTMAAIAIGPISGCSLNPAVSIGGFLATHAMAEPAVAYPPAIHVLQYILSSVVGALIAALCFYAVQGGLTNTCEYAEHGIEKPPRPSIPQVAQPMNLTKDLPYKLPEHSLGHDLICGISWAVDPMGKGIADIDSVCVKMDSTGKKWYPEIYHSNKNGEEDKSGGVVKSIIEHLGDNFEGRGALVTTESMQKKVKDEADCERIVIRQLSRLVEVQPKSSYLFFVVTMFTHNMYFSDMSEMTLRIVDTQTEEDILQWSKQDFQEKKVESNTIIVGVLYTKANQWFFRAIDDHMKIKDSHKSHRSEELTKRLSQLVQEIHASSYEDQKG